MAILATNDLAYLAVRLHARRSRMAEGERLETLCQARAISDLGQQLRPEWAVETAATLQRRLVQELVVEFSFCLRHLRGRARALVQWLKLRFQVENLKVLLRDWRKHTTFDELKPHLADLPTKAAFDAETLLLAETPAAFASRLPDELPWSSLKRAMLRRRDQPDVFILEATLDSGYLRGLLDQIERLPAEEKHLIRPLAQQQVEQFHFLLALRGKWIHGYAPESLAPLRVPASNAAGERFKAMLAAGDIPALVNSGLGGVFDELPAASGSAPEAGSLANVIELESLAARRFLRLANRAFRLSHLGLAAVVGYLELRRIEVANLITLSEGIRLGLASESLRNRLTQRASQEVHHV